MEGSGRGLIQLLTNAIQGSQRLGPDQNQASPIYKPRVKATLNFPVKYHSSQSGTSVYGYGAI
jgi:hypothetical protein